MITVGSLFSGIGGIELGFERSGGFETKWFVEKDEYARAILSKHWPRVSIYTDITTIKWENVSKVDILTGGFPCQDISYAGKGLGIEKGSRSGLWKEYYKAIRALQPRVVFVENVSALLSRGLDIVLGDLATLGYDAEWESIPASAIGAPHRRDRVWIMAYPINYSDRDSKQRESQKEGVSSVQDRQNNDRPRKFIRTSTMVERTEKSNSDKTIADVVDSYSQRWKLPCNRKNGGNSQETSTERTSFISSNVANSDSRRIQTHREGRSGTSKEMAAEYKQSGGRLKSFRMDQQWWSVEPDVGRVAHGVSFRVDRIKCLGNAVVPQVAEFWAERIKEKFEEAWK